MNNSIGRLNMNSMNY